MPMSAFYKYMKKAFKVFNINSALFWAASGGRR